MGGPPTHAGFNRRNIQTHARLPPRGASPCPITRPPGSAPAPPRPPRRPTVTWRIRLLGAINCGWHMTSNGIVQKLWNYCNILRDDGLSYGDYVEQLTFLLFLKMAEEQRQLGKARMIPKELDWKSL